MDKRRLTKLKSKCCNALIEECLMDDSFAYAPYTNTFHCIKCKNAIEVDEVKRFMKSRSKLGQDYMKLRDILSDLPLAVQQFGCDDPVLTIKFMGENEWRYYCQFTEDGVASKLELETLSWNRRKEK